MQKDVFIKMRLKKGTVGRAFFAPQAYLEMIKEQDIVDFEGENPIFFHLFVTSKEEYHERIKDILPMLNEHSRLWISYKKSTKNRTYNINRDSFFSLAEKDHLRPFSNVALDEEWSCLGFKKA
jgi:hypothetical protein